MKTFADKIKDSRGLAGMTQDELGQAVGVSGRAIQTYERGEKKPRQGTLLRLAKALKVSVRYLKDDNCLNPLEDIEMDEYIMEASEHYGKKGADDVQELLTRNAALFAGGELSDEQKDDFFQGVLKAYLICKEEAKKRYTTNANKNRKKE